MRRMVLIVELGRVRTGIFVVDAGASVVVTVIAVVRTAVVVVVVIVAGVGGVAAVVAAGQNVRIA